MGHDITIRRDGKAEAAFAMTPAWHELGTVFDHPMSSQEALEEAGLAWDVLQEKAWRRHVRKTEEGERLVTYSAVPNVLLNIREDTGEMLGNVSEKYTVVQNVEAFQFLDGLIEGHEMEYESAFSLSGGKKVVMLARLPKVDEIVAGDETLRYLLLSLHHDGSGAINFGPTSVRVVCANTYALALGRSPEIRNVSEEWGGKLSIRHTGDTKAKLETAGQLIVQANQQFDLHAEQSQLLARAQLTEKLWQEYLDVVCPIPDQRDAMWSERREARIREQREKIEEAFHHQRQHVGGAGGTLWAAYNAFSEHIDHMPRRGRDDRARAETRFRVTLLNTGMEMKRHAFETALRFAGVSA